MKKIKLDTDAIRDHLINKLGDTFHAACVPREAVAKRATSGAPAVEGSRLINPARSPKPWVSVQRVVADGSWGPWIRSHLDTKITWM